MQLTLDILKECMDDFITHGGKHRAISHKIKRMAIDLMLVRGLFL